MGNNLVVYSAKVYDMTEVLALKKIYDKDHKRKPAGNKRKWDYQDENELQRSKRILGEALERLRLGIELPQQPTQISGRGLKA